MQKHGRLKNRIVSLKTSQRQDFSGRKAKAAIRGANTDSTESSSFQAVKRRKQTFTQQLQKLADTHLWLRIGRH